MPWEVSTGSTSEKRGKVTWEERGVSRGTTQRLGHGWHLHELLSNFTSALAFGPWRLMGQQSITVSRGRGCATCMPSSGNCHVPCVQILVGVQLACQRVMRGPRGKRYKQTNERGWSDFCQQPGLAATVSSPHSPQRSTTYQCLDISPVTPVLGT